MSVETLGVERVEIEQHRLRSQFSRMLLLDLGISEYLSQINHSEMTYREEFIEAVDFTTHLIRKSLFLAFVDILDYGDTRMVRETVEVVELCRKYQNYEVEGIKVEGNAQDVFDRINGFIKDQQGLDYANTYGIIK